MQDGPPLLLFSLCCPFESAATLFGLSLSLPLSLFIHLVLLPGMPLEESRSSGGVRPVEAQFARPSTSYYLTASSMSACKRNNNNNINYHSIDLSFQVHCRRCITKAAADLQAPKSQRHQWCSRVGPKQGETMATAQPLAQTKRQCGPGGGCTSAAAALIVARSLAIPQSTRQPMVRAPGTALLG